MQEITVNLHNHSSFSRGEQKYHSLAQAGLTAGIDVLIVTDANVYVSGKEQYYYRDERRLLLLTGEEVFRSFPNDTGHMLILNGGREMANQADTPQQLINFCSQWEGLTIIAHPFDGLTEREVLAANREGLISGRADSARSPLNSPWINWEIQNFTGIEILNLQSEYKTAGQRKRFGLSDFFIRSTGVDRLTHASLAALQKWDEFLTAGRRVAAYCGSACVNFAQWAAGRRLEILDESHLFAAAKNHLYLSEPLSGDLESDRANIYRSLKLGRGFVSIDWFRPTDGFVFKADTAMGTVYPGDRAALDAGATIKIEIPTEKSVCRLIHQGKILREWENVRSIPLIANRPGYYRVEVYIPYRFQLRGWIYTNPIYFY